MSTIKYDYYIVDNLKYNSKKINDVSASEVNDEQVSYQYSQPTLGLSNGNESLYFKANISVQTKILDQLFREISFDLVVFYQVEWSNSETVDDIVKKYNKDIFLLSLGKVKDIVKSISQVDYRPPILIEDIPMTVQIKISEKKNDKD